MRRLSRIFSACGALALAVAATEPDANALERIYSSTGGATWKNSDNWTSSFSTCDWYGVSCTENGVALLLEDNNLTGYFPEALNDLGPSLERFWFGNDPLSGTVPKLDALTSLTRFWMDNVKVSGTLPYSAFANSPNFYGIVTYDSKALSGTIAPELANLTSLGQISVQSTGISGTLPAALGKAASLNTIQVHEGLISGTLPAALGKAASLNTIQVHEGLISGTVPPELASAGKLGRLYLGLNTGGRMTISGTLPDELRNLASLSHLYAQSTMMSGTLPNLGLWGPTVKRLNFGRDVGDESPWGSEGNEHDAHISGTLPSFLPTALQGFTLGHSRLSGTIPPTFASMHDSDQRSYLNLYLKKNLLSGTLSDELASWKKLQPMSGFMVQKNVISGTLSPRLFSTGKFQTFQAEANKISGTIPFSAIAQGQRIEVHPKLNMLYHAPGTKDLDLVANMLSGTLPTQFGDIEKLSSLWVHNNHMSGTIPQVQPETMGACILSEDQAKAKGYGDALPFYTSNLPLPKETNAFDCPIPESKLVRVSPNMTKIMDGDSCYTRNTHLGGDGRTCSFVYPTEEEQDLHCPRKFYEYYLGTFSGEEECAQACLDATEVEFPPAFGGTAPCKLALMRSNNEWQVQCAATSLALDEDGSLTCPTNGGWSKFDDKVYDSGFVEFNRYYRVEPGPREPMTLQCADLLECTCPSGCVPAGNRSAGAERNLLFGAIGADEPPPSPPGPGVVCPEGCAPA